MRRRIILLFTVAAMMAMMLVGSAVPAFALPEHFLDNLKDADGPTLDSLPGLTIAANKTKPNTTGDIVVVKVKDKASADLIIE